MSARIRDAVAKARKGDVERGRGQEASGVSHKTTRVDLINKWWHASMMRGDEQGEGLEGGGEGE